MCSTREFGSGDALISDIQLLSPTFRVPASTPAGWSDFADGLAQPTDLLIPKHQWGAFYAYPLFKSSAFVSIEETPRLPSPGFQTEVRP